MWFMIQVPNQVVFSDKVFGKQWEFNETGVQTAFNKIRGCEFEIV